MLFNIYPAYFLAIKVLTNCDANTVGGQHRFRILLVVFAVVVVTPTMVVRQVALIDKVHPAARRHVSWHPVDPAFVNKYAKVDATCNDICTRHRIIDTVMFKDIAGVDHVVPLTPDHPISTVTGKDHVIVVRSSGPVAADDLAQFPKFGGPDRPGAQEGQQTAVAQNGIGIEPAHVGIAGTVDHVATGAAKNDIIAAAGQDDIVPTNAVRNCFKGINLVRPAHDLKPRDNRIAITEARRDGNFDGDFATRQAGGDNIVT